jgi:hypothetical protein
LKRTNKTAELLARPILHATKGKEHTFYIIDNNTKYQYTTTTPTTQTQKKARIKIPWKK